MKSPRNCAGGYWAEAIGALNIRSAELRMEAAKIGQDNAGGDPYGDWTNRFNQLHREAGRLDELSEWLRDREDPLPAPPTT